jgi:HEPN domain
VPQGRPIPGSPQEWLARARGDLALARAPLPEGRFYEDLCFHAQQALQKALEEGTPTGTYTGSLEEEGAS